MNTTTAWCDQAAQALRQSGIPALRAIRVDDVEGTLVISGRVPSYYFKQLAQETVLHLLSGQRLVNHLTVVNGQS